MIERRLEAQLEPIARDFRRGHLLRRLAAGWAVAALLGIGFLLVRWFTGWTAPWVFFAPIMVALAAAGRAVYRFCRAPLDYRALARRIEQANPQLQALLLTAVEQQPASATGHLNYLQQQVIQQALQQHRQRPWEEFLVGQLFATRAAQWSALALLALVLAGLRPSLAAGRNLPPSYGPWAAHSHGVSVTPGDTTLERGSSLVVLARFEGRLPPEATLAVKPLNENERRIPLAKNLDDPVFGGTIPEVKSDLRYRIEFPGGQTREFKVAVFDYPRLERADVTVTYPRYTGLPDKTILDTRRVSAVEGSTLDFTFLLNKPVRSAKLTTKDKTGLTPTPEAANSTVYHTRLTLDQSRRFELLLVDEAGRTNRLPPEFVLQALKNAPPEIKLVAPRGDQRVSALEEINFQAEVSDDLGLRAYGLAYTLAGQETKTIELGGIAAAREKRQFSYLLPLEKLGAHPDQLLSYYVWADDFGPDGKVRRTASDLFFAEVRPFEEIFREGQPPDRNQGSNSGGQPQSETQKLAELQKQITSATWNLQRRESGPKPSAQYKQDAEVVQQSQQQALEQARSRKQNIQDPQMWAVIDQVEKEMQKAANRLGEAVAQNSVTPLPPALANEQAASQGLLKLQSREYQVSRGRQSAGRGAGAQSAQRQVDQLDLKQSENRYETQRQAAAAQNPAQREQLQVLNRLKELAQRQQDLNARLKELQAALQEAKTEAEREEVRRRLKHLRDEQQQMLADVDELRQRMDRSENASNMAEARQQLEQTRSEVQSAAQALERESAAQALASGTRAQRDLEQLRDDFRKQTSNQFAEEMRRLRNDARQLAQKEESISKKMDELAGPKQKTLSDAPERRDLATQLAQQQAGLTNVFTQMREVSERSETAAPLLSEQLYDLIRQTRLDELNKQLEISSELVRRGFIPQASPIEQRARQTIDSVKRGVERAAEGVLGDETEALRLAKRELDDLSRLLDQELAAADAANAATNAAGSNRNAGNSTNSTASSASPQSRGNPGDSQGQRAKDRQNQNPSAQPSGQGQQAAAGQRSPQTGQAGTPQGGQPGGQQPGPRGGQGSADQSGQALAQAGGQRGGNTGSRSGGTTSPNPGPGQRNAGRAGANFWQGGAYGGGGSGDPTGPLTGEGFVDWSDRLRTVEEILEVPDLRTEVATIRDRARVVRQDYKRNGKKPDWAVVHTQIASPLAEVRSRVSEELARRESSEALVPIDRDPVPAKFSELVRRYYEQLGKSD